MGSGRPDVKRRVLHSISVALLLSLIYLSALVQRGVSGSPFSALDRYGLLLTCVLYVMQHVIIFSLPFYALNFLGVVFINIFPPSPMPQKSPPPDSCLCFRVVTRGMYPNLVNENVRTNLSICEKQGLTNYLVEVVTEVSTKLEPCSRVREIIVPASYRTPRDTLFKARALQFALEPHVHILDPGDWIIHLDEETRLSEDAVVGIINFVQSGKHSFGQGVVFYGKGGVVNWITTLAESLRVGIDYGCYRFTLGFLNKPFFGWKGSFMVAKVQAEMEVSFDFGPEGSIAEDCFFSCIASKKGYSFGFVQGEMLEISTFSLKDFVQQRRRWMHGIFLTSLSKQIPLQYKIGQILLTASNIVMPINLLLFPIGVFLPLPMSQPIAWIYSFILGTYAHLCLLGTILTFCVRPQRGFLKCCFLLLATLPCGLVACLLENVSSFLVFWIPQTSTYSFYIVSKDELVF